MTSRRPCLADPFPREPYNARDISVDLEAARLLAAGGRCPAAAILATVRSGAFSMATAGERAGAALVIGIGEYLHAGQVCPLRFAAHDAEAMAEALTDSEVCGFPADKVRLLTDSDAARDAVAHHLSKW